MPRLVPAEWSPHRAMWLGFPSHGDIWLDHYEAAQAEVAALALALAGPGAERVRLMVCGDEAEATARLLIGAAPGIELVRAQFGDVWLRDTGPIFLKKGEADLAEGFVFNGWGGKYDFPGDDVPIVKGSALKALEGDKGELGEQAIMQLADALDTYIPTPERAIDGTFLMPIEDVFSISGRGTVVTGRIERGIVKVGEEIEIVGIKPTIKTTCTGVEMFRKLLDQGQAGDNVGVLLRGTKREEVERGQVLAKPNSIKPHTKFECEVYVLSKDEGGRHTPFFNNYRPQFYFRTTDVTGSVVLPEGTEMVMPGDNVKMTVTLIAPIAMEQGLRFAIREGGRTVGAGVVAKIFE